MRLLFLTLLFFISSFVLRGQTNKDNLQPDSLTSTRDTVSANELIYFTAKLAKPIYVPTIVCSCGNTDFYYRLYIWKNNAWELFLKHEDEFSREQCTCIQGRAVLVNGGVYHIKPTGASGKFRLEIKSILYEIVSNEFIVKN